MTYDPLVYIALIVVAAVIGIAAYVVKTTPETGSIETQKIRFAAATFTGILVLFMFVSILYFVDANGPGREIFEKAFSVLSPIAGGIIGYFFAARNE